MKGRNWDILLLVTLGTLNRVLTDRKDLLHNWPPHCPCLQWLLHILRNKCTGWVVRLDRDFYHDHRMKDMLWGPCSIILQFNMNFCQALPWNGFERRATSLANILRSCLGPLKSYPSNKESLEPLSMFASGSKDIMNKRGDRGHHHLTPLWIQKGAESTLLTGSTAVVGKI